MIYEALACGDPSEIAGREDEMCKTKCGKIGRKLLEEKVLNALVQGGR